MAEKKTSDTPAPDQLASVDDIPALIAQVRELQSQLSHFDHYKRGLMAAAKMCSLTVNDSLYVTNSFNTIEIFGEARHAGYLLDKTTPALTDFFVRIQTLGRQMARLAESSSSQPWTTVFPGSSDNSSDFDRWIQMPPGGWGFNGYSAVSKGDSNVEFYIVSEDELVGPRDDFRIEYTAKAEGEPQDLSVVVGTAVKPGVLHVGNDRPETNGYCFTFGGFHNQATELQRCMHAVFSSKKVRIEAGREHHCVAERVGGILRFSVDGKDAYSVVDHMPIMSSGHGYVGFYTCAKDHSFRDVKVMVRPTCLTPALFKEIDSLRCPVIELPEGPSRYVEIHYVGGSTFFLKDVTEVVEDREELEAERRHREKMEAFLSLARAAAHEMNQPLTVILGNVQLMMQNAPEALPGPMRTSLEDLKESATKMSSIVRKIGTIKDYQTKPYVGKMNILDIDASQEERK